jgi:hypothetical protein
MEKSGGIRRKVREAEGMERRGVKKKRRGKKGRLSKERKKDGKERRGRNLKSRGRRGKGSEEE